MKDSVTIPTRCCSFLAAWSNDCCELLVYTWAEIRGESTEADVVASPCQTVRGDSGPPICLLSPC